MVKSLKLTYGPTRFTEENVMISATHTHSGPAGYLDHFLYVANTFGVSEGQRDAQAQGIMDSINQAISSASPDYKLSLHVGKVSNASRNRSPTSYLANPEHERDFYSRQGDDNTDRNMTLLAIKNKQTSTLSAFVNWFAVHGTSMPETEEYVSGDNKGYASFIWEQGGISNTTSSSSSSSSTTSPPFVAAFAQSNAGDVTPNTSPPTCQDSGLPCDGSFTSCPDAKGNFRITQCIGRGPGGLDGFLSTKIIGQKQAEGARDILDKEEGALQLLDNTVAFRHIWVDMYVSLLSI